MNFVPRGQRERELRVCLLSALCETVSSPSMHPVIVLREREWRLLCMCICASDPVCDTVSTCDPSDVELCCDVRVGREVSCHAGSV